MPQQQQAAPAAIRRLRLPAKPSARVSPSPKHSAPPRAPPGLTSARAPSAAPAAATARARRTRRAGRGSAACPRARAPAREPTDAIASRRMGRAARHARGREGGMGDRRVPCGSHAPHARPAPGRGTTFFRIKPSFEPQFCRRPTCTSARGTTTAGRHSRRAARRRGTRRRRRGPG